MATQETLNRRTLLGKGLALGACALIPGLTAGCSKPLAPLKLSTHPWPPYELFHVADKSGFFPNGHLRLLEVPSATASLQLLAAGNADAATLTLDEVITARADNMPLTVIALLDVSCGADMLLGSPDIKQLADLKGRRIGVEQSAVGAVMLHAVLEKAGLGTADITIAYATVDEHVALFNQGAVDALVTYQPVPQQLQAGSFNTLFDSREIRGRILDVLVATPKAVSEQQTQLRSLVAGYFKALQSWQTTPAKIASLIAPRLQIREEQVAESFNGLELPDLTENRAWFDPTGQKLLKSAEQLQQIMLAAELIRTSTNLSGIVDHQFLTGL